MPGLGTGADLYYERSSRGSGTSSTTWSPSVISQLSQRLEESERARTELERERLKVEQERLALERERSETLHARDEYISQLQATLDRYNQIFSQQCSSTPFPRRDDDPHDPPASCAT